MNKKITFLLLAVLLAVLLSASTGSAHADEINFAFNTGESFAVQDVTNEITVTFTVASGTLNGAGSIFFDTDGGTVTITPTTTGTLTVAANNTSFFFVNGAAYTLGSSYSFTSGNPFTFLWQFTPQPTSTPIVVTNQGTLNATYYLRSDSQTTNNVTAYALKTSNTNGATTLSDTASGSSVTWGFRVFTVHWNGQVTELTSGTPQATVTRSTAGSGAQTATWTPPYTNLDLGYDALEVRVYERINSGSWLLKGTYLSPSLLYKAVQLQTWTFTIYTNATIGGGTVTASYSFGSSGYASAISNVGFVQPSQFDIQTYNMNAGNWIGFILGAYVAEIGAAAYVIILLIPTASLYMRYRSFAPVVFFFILFGGPGGLVWFFVPMWAAAVADALLILGFAFIVWKVIR